MITPFDQENASFSKLPKDITEAIAEILTETFQSQSEKGTFKAQGHVYASEIVLRAGYLESGRISQINFDLSIKTSPQSQQAVKDLDELTAVAKELFVSYFKSENLEDFSYTWKPYPTTSAKPIHYKYDGTNTNLENEADKLLGENQNESLVIGDMSEAEAIEQIIESLQKTKA